MRTSAKAIEKRLRDLPQRLPRLHAACVSARKSPESAGEGFCTVPVMDELYTARERDPVDYQVLLDIVERHGGEISSMIEEIMPVPASAQVGVGEAEVPPDDTDSDDWPPPTPLDESGDLPTFPVACLPRWLAEYAESVAVATQVPVDLPAMVGLAILSLAGAKKFRVVVRPGWQEPLNIYSLTVLPPGNRKSAVFSDMTAPVVDWEREELERQRPKIAATKVRKELAEARAQKARANSLRSKRVSRR